MSPDLRDPSDPQSWLRRARSNLARARAGRPTAEVLYEDLCFDAQQAAEKAVKGVLVARQRDFPKTHVVERLLALVEAAGVEVPVSLREAGDLTVRGAESLPGSGRRDIGAGLSACVGAGRAGGAVGGGGDREVGVTGGRRGR